MDKKYIDGLGATLPKLGFGCMRLPKKDGKIHFEEAKKMIHHAMANGLNYFDTAYNYHDFQSEKFLGQVLPEFPRESYFLTSKLPIWLIENESDAERIFNEQLQNCNADYFDFYLLHAMNTKRIDTMEKFNLYNFIAKKKAEGKIKHIGFSFHSKTETLEKLVAMHKWDFVQLQINYLDWDEIKASELYEVLEKHNIPCFVMEPVRGGYLSSFAPQVEKIMKNFAPDNSISSWALRWVASLNNVALVLSGMSNMEQLKDNIDTFTNFKTMNNNELNRIQEVLSELGKIKPVPCTGCRYCMDCQYGVDIPGVFDIYNNHKKTENNKLTYINYFNNLDESKRADNCRQCGECVTKCPQQIDIPAEMEKIEQEMIMLKN